MSESASRTRAAARAENRAGNRTGDRTSGQPVERRRSSRYDCEGYAEVVLPSGGLHFRGRILNLSLSGCFVEANFNLERGTRVEVYFETRCLRFRVAGTVAALRSKRGVGVLFVALTQRRALQIAELVQELKEVLEEDFELKP